MTNTDKRNACIDCKHHELWCGWLVCNHPTRRHVWTYDRVYGANTQNHSLCHAVRSAQKTDWCDDWEALP